MGTGSAGPGGGTSVKVFMTACGLGSAGPGGHLGEEVHDGAVVLVEDFALEAVPTMV